MRLPNIPSNQVRAEQRPLFDKLNTGIRENPQGFTCRPELLRCGFQPLHAPSGENQVVTRARRKLFGAPKADAGMTAFGESCWREDLL
jgi:hypothetical protein